MIVRVIALIGEHVRAVFLLSINSEPGMVEQVPFCVLRAGGEPEGDKFLLTSGLLGLVRQFRDCEAFARIWALRHLSETVGRRRAAGRKTRSARKKSGRHTWEGSLVGGVVARCLFQENLAVQKGEAIAARAGDDGAR